MGHCEITRGRQALELRSNLCERRSLTDKIQFAHCTASSARNLQWAVSHGISLTLLKDLIQIDRLYFRVTIFLN